MQGLNWFGFETASTNVAGLWAGFSSLTQDFATVVWRMKLLGFNAVRLPFSFQVGRRIFGACTPEERSLTLHFGVFSVHFKSMRRLEGAPRAPRIASPCFPSQVLFLYGPAYLQTYCNAAGDSAVVQNVVQPGNSPPGGQPPALVRHTRMHAPCHATGHSQCPVKDVFSYCLAGPKYQSSVEVGELLAVQERGPVNPASSVCNADVPSDTVYKRFLHVVCACAALHAAADMISCLLPLHSMEVCKRRARDGVKT